MSVLSRYTRQLPLIAAALIVVCTYTEICHLEQLDRFQYARVPDGAKSHTKTTPYMINEEEVHEEAKQNKAKVSDALDKKGKTLKVSKSFKKLSTKTSDESNAATSTSARKQILEKEAATNLPTIDALVIGSNSSAKYRRRHSTQRRTFLRHRSFRHIFFIAESDDAEPACATDLTIPQVQLVLDHCAQPFDHKNASVAESHPASYPGAPLLNRHFSSVDMLLRNPKIPRPAAWLCAQPRPLVGLKKAMDAYDDKENELPDYFLILDDDSWLNLDLMLPQLREEYGDPVKKARIIVGCLIRSQWDFGWTWYWGGFGAILTQGAVRRLRTPLKCNRNKQSAFVRQACNAIKRSRVGESQFFREGMTVVDLMDAYVRQQPYLKVANWNPGFCMHSDLALAYFFNTYRIGDEFPAADLDPPAMDRLIAYVEHVNTTQSAPSVHRTRKVNRFKYISHGYCRHASQDTCSVQSHLCHYVTPDHMEAMFSEIRDVHPRQYRPFGAVGQGV